MWQVGELVIWPQSGLLTTVVVFHGYMSTTIQAVRYAVGPWKESQVPTSPKWYMQDQRVYSAIQHPLTPVSPSLYSLHVFVPVGSRVTDMSSPIVTRAVQPMSSRYRSLHALLFVLRLPQMLSRRMTGIHEFVEKDFRGEYLSIVWFWTTPRVCPSSWTTSRFTV